MRLWLARLSLLWVVLGPVALAAGPDDEFIEIYSLIQQADALQASGQAAAAAPKYQAAQEKLRKFQKAHPSWNEKLIQFRLGYVAKKLQALPGETTSATLPSPARAGPAATNNLSTPPEPAGPSPEQLALQKRVETAQERLRQLEADKALLEARLREALTAQPAAVDPRELEKAEARVKALQKENDLLKVSLEQQRVKLAAVVEAAVYQQAIEELRSARHRLAQQDEALAALRQEREVLQRRLKTLSERTDRAVKDLTADNERLRQQVAELEPKAADAAQVERLRENLALAQKALTEEQALTERLRAEKLALEKRLGELAATLDLHADGRVIELERSPELDQLREQVMARVAALQEDLQQTRGALTTEQARVAQLTAEKNDLARRWEESAAREHARADEIEQLKQGLIQAETKLAAEQARVEELQAENTKLAGAVKDLRVALAAASEAKPPSAEVPVLPPGGAALESEARRADALQAENAALEQRYQALLARREAEARAEAAALEKQLAAARADAEHNAALVARLQTALAALEQEKQAWERERARFEIRVASTAPIAPGGGADAEKVKRLEQQREALQQRIDALTKELADAKAKADSARSDTLGKELDAALAKLRAYEAERVPYTAEELALFKKPAASITRLESARSASARHPLPAGAEPFAAEAQKAFAEGRLDDASASYREILKREPASVFALANLAVVQIEQKRFSQAEEHLRRALEIDPDDVHSLSQLGYLNYLQEKSDAAIDALSKAAKLDPGRAEVHNYLGLALSQKGLRFQAETALRKSVQLQPGYGSGHYNLAVVYATQQPPFVALARWHYEKALAAGQRPNPDLEKLIETQQR